MNKAICQQRIASSRTRKLICSGRKVVTILTKPRTKTEHSGTRTKTSAGQRQIAIETTMWTGATKPIAIGRTAGQAEPGGATENSEGQTAVRTRFEETVTFARGLQADVGPKTGRGWKDDEDRTTVLEWTDDVGRKTPLPGLARAGVEDGPADPRGRRHAIVFKAGADQPLPRATVLAVPEQACVARRWKNCGDCVRRSDCCGKRSMR
jgi:hypothetical protein